MTHPLLPPPVNGFLEAINRNDTDAFLAYFPHDGAVDDWGTRYVGHARIKAWSCGHPACGPEPATSTYSATTAKPADAA